MGLKTIRNSTKVLARELNFQIAVSLKRPEGVDLTPEVNSAFVQDEQGNTVGKIAYRAVGFTMPITTTLTPSALLELIHSAVAEKEAYIMETYGTQKSGTTQQQAIPVAQSTPATK